MPGFVLCIGEFLNVAFGQESINKCSSVAFCVSRHYESFSLGHPIIRWLLDQDSPDGEAQNGHLTILAYTGLANTSATFLFKRKFIHLKSNQKPKPCSQEWGKLRTPLMGSSWPGNMRTTAR